MQLNQTQLLLQHAENHLTYLRSEIEHDFGLVALESRPGYTSQAPLPFDRIVTRLEPVSSLPIETEMTIRRLKGIISRLGPVNPEALTAYNAAKERHDFLTQQTADLEEALLPSCVRSSPNLIN